MCKDDKNWQQRKSIRLSQYDYSQNGATFITICTFDHAPLFGHIEPDAVGAHLCVRPHRPDLMVSKWLFELENRFAGVVIDHYAIMPDHIHFIIFQTGGHAGPPLPDIIQWYKTQTTNEYIRLVKSGSYPSFHRHIWQRSFYDHIIRNDDDLLQTRKYIDENPAKWWYTHSQNISG